LLFIINFIHLGIHESASLSYSSLILFIKEFMRALRFVGLDQKKLTKFVEEDKKKGIHPPPPRRTPFAIANPPHKGDRFGS
jgi:hypothetical protein